MENSRSKNQFVWREKLLKCPIDENDLKGMGIWEYKDEQFNNLYLSSERKDCILIQGAGFMYKGFVFLTLGIGAINVLEAFSQFDEIDGVVGTGNALFLSRDGKYVFSALSEQETSMRYEIDKTRRKFKYSEGGKLGPLIILNRVFMNKKEFDETKVKKNNDIAFDLGNTFFTNPVKYSGKKNQDYETNLLILSGPCIVFTTQL